MKLFLLLCAFSFVHEALSFFVFEGVSEGMLCILIYLSLWNSQTLCLFTETT